MPFNQINGATVNSFLFVPLVISLLFGSFVILYFNLFVPINLHTIFYFQNRFLVFSRRISTEKC